MAHTMGVFRKQSRGESLLEVIVAISMLVIVVTGASMLQRNAIISIGSGRRFLVGQTLAKTGIELVKRTLLSNRLKFPNDLDACWFAMPQVSAATDCASSPLTDGSAPDSAQTYSFQISIDPATGVSQFEYKNPPLDLEDGIDASDESFRLYLDEDETRYLHEPADPSVVEQTPFFRQVTLSYPESNILVVTSSVQWFEGTRLRDAALSYLWRHTP